VEPRHQARLAARIVKRQAGGELGIRRAAGRSSQLANSALGQETSQVRTWHAYQRHTALPALAMAILAAAQAQTNTSAATQPAPRRDRPPEPRAAPDPACRRHARSPARPVQRPPRRPLARTPDQPCPTDIGLAELTDNQPRRLMSRLAGTAAQHAKTRGLAWSTWRRRNQAIAPGATGALASAPSHKHGRREATQYKPPQPNAARGEQPPALRQQQNPNRGACPPAGRSSRQATVGIAVYNSF
jgi:hypothetical protein